MADVDPVFFPLSEADCRILFWQVCPPVLELPCRSVFKAIIWPQMPPESSLFSYVYTVHVRLSLCHCFDPSAAELTRIIHVNLDILHNVRITLLWWIDV